MTYVQICCHFSHLSFVFVYQQSYIYDMNNILEKFKEAQYQIDE